MRLLIVNLITLLGFCCTVACLYLIFNNFNLGLILVLANLSIISDFVDGFLARRLNAVSNFGKIFDLIHDFFLYLILPVFFAFYKQPNYFLLTLFTGLIVSGAFRLIRFANNGIVLHNNKTYWIGMPVIYNLILIPLSLLKSSEIFYLICIFVTASIFLMPSRIRFLKLKIKPAMILLITFNLLCLTALWL
ncbi:MAG: CDP-alcohol phosphatidyltransferase family protein [bacterium]